MAKKIEMPREELEKFIASGMTQDEIADHYDCATITVKKRMRDYGLKSPRGKQAIDQKLIDSIYEDLQESITDDLKYYFSENNFHQDKQNDDFCKIQILTKKQAIYQTQEDSLILFNTEGDIGIAASEIKGINTNVSLNLNGNIGILEPIDDKKRSLSIINPIISGGDDILVVLANYHNIDSYVIEHNKPIAKLSIVKRQNAIWLEN